MSRPGAEQGDAIGKPGVWPRKAIKSESMRSVRRTLLTALRDLNELQVQFALIGGLAVSARAEARMTRDVDFAVRVQDDSEAEQLVYQLQRTGYEVISTVEQVTTNRLATARLKPKTARDDGAVLDLLFASSGIEPEIVSEAEQATFLWGIRGPLALTAHLIALKVLSIKSDHGRKTRQICAPFFGGHLLRSRKSPQCAKAYEPWLSQTLRPLLTLFEQAQAEFISS